MVVEFRAHQFDVPWPVMLGIRGGMDADIATTALIPGFECGLLAGVEDISACIEEQRYLVIGQLVDKDRSVVCHGDSEIVFNSESLNRGDTVRNGSMGEARSLGEDQHVEAVAIDSGR